MLIDKLFTCFHLLRVHWVGLSYLWNEGSLEIYGMVERLSRGELPIFWFIKDLGVLSVLWGKLLFCLLGSLSEGGGEHKLLDVEVIFP